MIPLLPIATMFSAVREVPVTTHLGPLLLVFACGVGFFWPIFTALYLVKGLWFLRRELQPMSRAVRLLSAIAVCAVVSISSVVVFNVFVAPRVGMF